MTPALRYSPLLSLTLALLLIAIPETCRAEDEIEYTIGAQYRVRAFSLRNGSFARLLDPNTRRALRDSGQESIDERQNFFDSRLRLKLIAARGKSLSLNLQFEIGDLVFGGNGAQLGTDGVNLETKWLYLEWTPGALPLTLRSGLYSEVTPKSIILSNDVAGTRLQFTPLSGAFRFLVEYIKAVDNSRVDLDNDGLLENDFNDRDIIYTRFDFTKLQPFTFGAYFITDINNTNDTPVAANVERDVYWFAGFFKGQVGFLGFSADGIYAFGDVRNGDNPGSARIEAFAIDTRITADLQRLGIEVILGWGSGDDPQSSGNEAFPVISPAYAHSNIIFDDYGGFNVTRGSLSGIAHISLLITSTPTPNLDLKAIIIWAMLTEDPRRSTNVNKINIRGRDFGLELGLNVSYSFNENLKFVSRSSVFLPSTGFEVAFDSSDDDPLIDVSLGLELRF